MTRISISLPLLIGGAALVAALALRTEPRPQARTHAPRATRVVEEAPSAPVTVRVAPPKETSKPVEKREEESVVYGCGAAPVALFPVLYPAEAPDQGWSEEASSTFCTVSR